MEADGEAESESGRQSAERLWSHLGARRLMLRLQLLNDEWQQLLQDLQQERDHLHQAMAMCRINRPRSNGDSDIQADNIMTKYHLFKLGLLCDGQPCQYSIKAGNLNLGCACHRSIWSRETFSTFLVELFWRQLGAAHVPPASPPLEAGACLRCSS